MGKIKIWDTTLCEGARSTGHQMNFSDKLEMALQLERLGVDVMEVGRAAYSPSDYTAVGEIASRVKESAVASLAKAIPTEIEVAADSLKAAVQPVLHMYMPVSASRIQNKLHMSLDEAMEHSVNMVTLAKNRCGAVMFSAEDATHSDPAYLYRLLEKVIAAGATAVSIQDTLGYAEPGELKAFLEDLREKVPALETVDLSIRGYNDLGLATANALAGIRAGANQVECTVTGIGKRAGCTPLEEVVVNLHSREDYYKTTTNIRLSEIYPTASLLSGVAGTIIAPDKPVIGSNVFVASSGYRPYESKEEQGEVLLSPEEIGVPQSQVVLGKHSGKEAFSDKLESMGYRFSSGEVDRYYGAFEALALKKKRITTKDIQALISHGKQLETPGKYQLDRFTVQSGNSITTTAAVRLVSEEGIIERITTGDGPIDAALLAVNEICGEDILLDSYSLNAITEGQDALGEAVLRVQRGEHRVSGRGLSTDIVEATIRAYVEAVNRLIEVEENDEQLL